jgi:hypothetical protein
MPSRSLIAVSSSILMAATLLSGAGSAQPGTSSWGPNWGVVGSPHVGAVGGGAGGVTAASPTNVWAVGGYSPYPESSASQPLTEHWDGSAWTFVKTPKGPPDSYVNFLTAVSAVSQDDVWAVGSISDQEWWRTWTVHWDGSSWTHVRSPNTDGPFSINVFGGVAAVAPDDVWAVGSNDTVAAEPLIEHWDGSRWSLVPTDHLASAYDLLAVSAVSATDVWAVGYGSTAHWDGSTWTAIKRPRVGLISALLAVDALSSSDVWAAGFSFDGNAEHALIEHWTGNRWNVVPSRNGPGGRGFLSGIAAVGPGDLWAVGRDDESIVHPLIEHWDGNRWSVASSAASTLEGQLFGVGVAETGEVWAAGSGIDQPLGTPLFEHICPIQVLDSGFSPPRAQGIPPGATVAWSIPSIDASGHTITDRTGRRLFDSGLRPPGSSFTFSFTRGRAYPVIDEATGNRGLLRVEKEPSTTPG